MGRLTRLGRFAWLRGNGWSDRLRLFYHTALKPALAFRGMSRYAPKRELCFGFRTPGNRPWRLHLRDNFVDASTCEEFFSGEHNFIPPSLSPLQPRVVYDIGANIGMATLYMAERFPNAKFFGFEPEPGNCEVCAANYANLPGARVFPWAVGSHSGTASFTFNAQDLRGGRLHSGCAPAAGAYTRRIEVRVVSLADLVTREHLDPPELLKIDVEGAELQVLQGMGPVANHVRRLLVETHGLELQDQCLDWLREHGFVARITSEAAPGFVAIWADRL